MTLHNSLIKHQIFVQRLAGSHAKDISGQLKLARDTAIDHVNKNGSLWSPGRFDSLEQQLDAVLGTIIPLQLNNLKEFALYESEFINKLLKRFMNVRSSRTANAKKIYDIILSRGMTVVQGRRNKTIPTVINQFVNRKRDQFIQVVKDGVVQQKEPKSIQDRLTEITAGLMAVQAFTLATTTVNHTASITRDLTYKENDVAHVRWVSILDSDICPHCEDLDGTEFDAEDAEIPPEHWNCRCHLEPFNE